MPGIGIGISPHFQQKKSLLSYWATRFPSALQAVPFSGTRIDLYWTNNGVEDYDNVSIEISTDGINFTEDSTVATGEDAANITGLTEVTDYWFRVRYIKTGNGSAYTSVVKSLTYATAMFDGDTIIWLQYEDLTTITKDGSNNQTEWRDKLGSANKINHVTNPPLWTEDGVHFQELDKMSGSFAIGQGFTIYVIMKITNVRNGLVIISSPNSGILCSPLDVGSMTFQSPPSGSQQVAAGMSLNTLFVYRGGNKYPANTDGFCAVDGTVDTGYVGQGAPDGLVIAGSGVPGDYNDFIIKEVIIRGVYEYPTPTSIYDYCVKKKLLT